MPSFLRPSSCSRSRGGASEDSRVTSSEPWGSSRRQSPSSWRRQDGEFVGSARTLRRHGGGGHRRSRRRRAAARMSPCSTVRRGNGDARSAVLAGLARRRGPVRGGAGWRSQPSPVVGWPASCAGVSGLRRLGIALSCTVAGTLTTAGRALGDEAFRVRRSPRVG